MGARRRVLVVFLLLASTTVAPPVAADSTTDFKIKPDLIETVSPDMQREIAGLQYLLNRHQLRQFFALATEEDRRQWIERWWRSQDPTPDTSTNEMRLEHNRRVRTARITYGWEEWPGWDHRGEVYVRYGPPEIQYDLDWDVSQQGAKSPGESWHYVRHDMQVVFEDYTLSGRYTLAMDPLGNKDTRRVYGGEGEGGYQGGVGAPIDAQFNRHHGHPIGPPVNWWYPFMPSDARKRMANFPGVLESHPASYPFNFDRDATPFVFAADRFKGGESTNRLDVSVEIRSAPSTETPAGQTQRFKVTAVIFDTDYGLVDKEQSEISIPSNTLVPEGQKWSPVQLVFGLPEGYYRMAVTVEEQSSGRHSSYRSTVSTRDYDHDMTISDILFCGKIDTTGRQSPFTRGRLEVVPHPRRSYSVNQTIPIYFELYNLDVDEYGVSSYTVEYWIVPRDSRRETYAASQFDASAHGSDVPLYITIDTDNLRPDDFEFHVKVTDKRTLFVAERTSVFHLLDN